MMLVRVLALAAKPAVAAAAVIAALAAAYAGYSTWTTASPTAFQAVQDDGQRLLISEFGEKKDTIVAVDPADPASRSVIAEVEHAPGYGIFATLSPDGRAIAYTALPPHVERIAPDTPAEAAIIGEDGDVTVLASDVDLLIAPVWSPDGQSIVVRKNTPEPNSAGSFELLRLWRDGTRETITRWTSAAVFPIGFTQDGSTLYFATLSETGAGLYRIAPDGSGEMPVAHLSDEIARDWKLSPDGATLAYTVAETGEDARLVAMTLDLETGVASEVVRAASGLTEQISTAWSPDGELAVTSLSDDGSQHRLAVGKPGEPSSFSVSMRTLDVPLDFAPDNSAIAVLAVSGGSPAQAGPGYLELVRRDGTRARLSENVDVSIVGWLQ